MGSKVTTVISLVIVVRYILLLSGSRLLLLHIHIMATSDVKISCIQMLFLLVKKFTNLNTHALVFCTIDSC